MATNKTTNYQMNAWVDADEVLVSEINDNFTTVDTTMKSNSDRITTLEGENLATRLSAVETKNTSQDTDIASRVKKDGTDHFTGDVTIQKSVAALWFDIGLTNKSGIEWNGNASNDYGFNLLYNGSTKISMTSTGLKVADAGNTLQYAKHFGQNVAFNAYVTTQVGTTVSVDTTSNTYHVLQIGFLDYELGSSGQFDGANSQYKVPKAGIYQVNIKARAVGSLAGTQFKAMLYKNDVYEKELDSGYLHDGGNVDLGGSCMVRCAKNDTLRVYYNLQNATAGTLNLAQGKNESYFQGFLAIPEEY